MFPNSAHMIDEIRQEFESVLSYVTGQESQKATADEMERGLFQRLLVLGGHLLRLFFVLRAQACSHRPTVNADGVKLPYHGKRQRAYFSIFGKIVFWRSYFYKVKTGGFCPLDAALNLPQSCHSDFLRELVEELAVHIPYQRAVEIIERVLRLKLSSRVLQESIATDALDVPAYYNRDLMPPFGKEATVLVIQADGKGIPLLRQAPAQPRSRLTKGEKNCSKKEAVVTGTYSIIPRPRTPEEVVNSFFKLSREQPTGSHPQPQHKHLWATLDGKEAALDHLSEQVQKRDGQHIAHRVALTDGCQALQRLVQVYFPDFELVVDFVHVVEYLWKGANALLGETHPERTSWVIKWTRQILSGHTEQIIAELTQIAQEHGRTLTQRKALNQVSGYFQRNLPFMRYDQYLAQGWPIATGVIEGACRHLVKDRFELSGMRWSQKGAEVLLNLRCVHENGDWESYHKFHRTQRYLRLYQTPSPESDAPEFLAMALAA